jgi:hypothetical protein
MATKDSRALLRSAQWCFQKLRDCRDPDLAAELRFLAGILLRQAQARLTERRVRRSFASIKAAA